MINDGSRQIRLIINNQRDDVFTRHIGGGYNDHFVPGRPLSIRDLRNPATRDGTPDRGAIQHVRKVEVVDILRPSSHLLRSFFPGNGFAHN